MPIDASDPDRPKAGQPEPFLRTPASETRPAFSHDGRWVAYTSNEYGGPWKCTCGLSTLPASENGGKWQISTRGWSVSHLVAKRS